MSKPSKYETWKKYNKLDDVLNTVTEMSKEGYIQKDIAKAIDISMDTFIAYKEQYPEFREAFITGKQIADRQVENALFKSAVGGEYVEITEELDKFGNMHVVKSVTRVIPGDVKAQIHWLKNRRPQAWGSANKVNLKLYDPFDKMTTKELKNIVKGDTYNESV